WSECQKCNSTTLNNEDYFMIERDTSSAFNSPNYKRLPNIPAKTDTASDATVLPNVLYWYRVRACTNGGGCSFYQQNSVYTSPSPISNLNYRLRYASTATGAGELLLTWTS